MKLLVKEYLKNHSFKQLENEYGINVRPNATFDKFSLSYDQIFSKSGDELAEQCRGLVVRPRVQLDEATWQDSCIQQLEVLAWPMNRFYNHGDVHAADVDWSDKNLRVYEKLDGTCVILYWDSLHKKWHVATRSVPEADIPINANNVTIGNMTFAQLFLKALIATREELSGKKVDWSVDGPEKVVHLNKEMTYVFELVSPYNQIVVMYPEPRAYLLAARHTMTGVELAIENINMEHVLRPKTWNIKDVVTLSAFVDSANPCELEGAVVCDASFRRMKVKNKTYVLAHKSKDTVMSSSRNALECVILEKVDDIVQLVPKEVADKLVDMQNSFAKYCKQIDERVSEFRHEAGTSRKRFAEQVLLSGDCSAPYFNMWENKTKSAREWFTMSCKNNKLSSSALDTILAKLNG